MNFFADGSAKANIKFEIRCTIIKGKARANATNIEVPIIKGVNAFIITSKARVAITTTIITSR